MIKLDKKEARDIYEKERDRLHFVPISRFKDRDFYECSNNVHLDGKITNLVFCKLCESSNKKSMFLTVIGTKNESRNCSSHYDYHHTGNRY